MVQLHVNTKIMAVRNQWYSWGKKHTPVLYSFTRVHARTGEQFDSNWLFYSKTIGSVYWFVCKLISPTVSKLTSGYNVWKQAHKMRLSHENSKQDLDEMAGLFTQKSERQIDSGLLKLCEVKSSIGNKFFWRIRSRPYGDNPRLSPYCCLGCQPGWLCVGPLQ